jgi:FHS family glucose/mannose:H+ symporter-like MFS transporter
LAKQIVGTEILSATKRSSGKPPKAADVPPHAARHHARANLVIHLAFAAAGIVTVVLGPILPILISRWSLTDERAGLFFTTQFCGQLAGCLSTGALIPIRRFGYRLTFAIGFGLVALGICALGVGNAPWALAGTALYGYGLGLGLTGGNLWVAEIFPGKRATAVSILNVAWTVGAIACGPLVMLAERGHMLEEFLVALGLVLGICALLIATWEIEPLEIPAEDLGSNSKGDGRDSRKKLFSPAAFALGALFFFYVGTEAAVGGWLAAFANRAESISAMMSALTPAFFWGGLMVGRALAPVVLRVLARLAEPEKALLACGVTLAAVAVGALLYSVKYQEALVCAGLAGLGLACVYPILVGWVVRIFGAHARRFGSVLFATGSMGGATLPWLVGAVSTHTGALRAGLAVPIAACVAMFLLNGFFSAHFFGQRNV